MEKIPELKILDNEEVIRLKPLVPPLVRIIKIIQLTEGGSRYIVYTRDTKGNNRGMYLIEDITRQFFRWELIAPRLEDEGAKYFRFFASEWEMGLGELHDVVLKYHPW